MCPRGDKMGRQYGKGGRQRGKPVVSDTWPLARDRAKGGGEPVSGGGWTAQRPAFSVVVASLEAPITWLLRYEQLT